MAPDAHVADDFRCRCLGLDDLVRCRHSRLALRQACSLRWPTGVDPLSQVGRTFRIFDWTGVSPIGTFAVDSPYLWDVSSLYTTGNVTFLAAGSAAVASLAAGCPRTHRLVAALHRTRNCVDAPSRASLPSILSPFSHCWRSLPASRSPPARTFSSRRSAPRSGSRPTSNCSPRRPLRSINRLPTSSTRFSPYDRLQRVHPALGALRYRALYRCPGRRLRHQSLFAPDAITLNPNGVYFMFMLVPQPGVTGDSRDFESGPVIPNSLFPLLNNLDVWLDGVLVDRAPGADAIIQRAAARRRQRRHQPSRSDAGDLAPLGR